MDNKPTIKRLIQDYLNGVSSNEAQKKIDDWFDLSAAPDGLQLTSEEEADDVRSIRHRLMRRRVLWYRPAFRVAATISMVCGFAAIYYFAQVQRDIRDTAYKITQHIQPALPSAMLMLDNGVRIPVNKAHLGQTINNLLEVEKRDIFAPALPHYLIRNEKYISILVPTGAAFDFELADGTKVWLNAGSRLSFPVDFSDTVRNVKLAGEGYFDVTKDPKRPFKVETGQQFIEVLGTKFNVSAYEGEVKETTTLLEGAVKLYRRGSSQAHFLHPGDRAVTKLNSVHVSLDRLAPAQRLEGAWKDGLFSFKDASITDVMETISRRYNVDVAMKDDLSAQKISGDIHMDTKLKDVLDLLSSFSLVFTVDETGDKLKIIVKQKGSK